MRLNLVGQEFGSLRVVSFAGLDKRRNSHWLCVCKCGGQRTLEAPNLRRVKGCQCRKIAVWKLRKESGDTITYHSYRGMIARCYDPNQVAYANYGGRGITVCDRWLNGGYPVFVEDMGLCPSQNHSIDRYPDNNGNYEPGNCRWATAKQQGRNKRTNRLITHDGRTMTLTEWAEQVGISFTALSRRIANGWPLERVLAPRVLRADHQGRVAAGAEVNTAKLTDDEVRSIRQRCLAGEEQKAVASEYNVLPSTISRICTRKSWKHVV